MKSLLENGKRISDKGENNCFQPIKSLSTGGGLHPGGHGHRSGDCTPGLDEVGLGGGQRKAEQLRCIHCQVLRCRRGKQVRHRCSAGLWWERIQQRVSGGEVDA